MTARILVEHSQDATGSECPNNSMPIEAAIHALEQRAIELDEAHYEALREARDASRRAAELRLQSLETRMRLCVLIEYEPVSKPTSEPIGAGQHTSTLLRPAVLRLVHMYFDDPGKHRLVLYLLRDNLDNLGTTSEEEGEPAWYSKMVYDSVRPEGKGAVAISEAVRAAYRTAKERGYRVTWPLLGMELGDGESANDGVDVPHFSTLPPTS